MRSDRKSRSVLIFLVGLGAALSFSATMVACGGKTDEPTLGSESHFLRHCDLSCEDDLSCVQGICTETCLIDDGDSCGSLPGSASCTNDSVESGKVAVCDVRCEEKDDCAKVGSSHQCDSGFCRAPRTDDAVDLETFQHFGPDEEGQLDCLPEGSLNSEGKLPCVIVETVTNLGDPLRCDREGRNPVERGVREAVVTAMREAGTCDGLAGTSCETLQICEIKQSVGDERTSCLQDEVISSSPSSSGFCYLDETARNSAGDLVAGGSDSGVNPLLDHCAPGERAALRFYGESTPARGTSVFSVCKAAAPTVEVTEFSFMEELAFSEDDEETLHCVPNTPLDEDGTLPCRLFHHVMDPNFDCGAPAYLPVVSEVTKTIRDESIKRGVCGGSTSPDCQDGIVCEVKQLSGKERQVCLYDEAISSSLPVDGFCFLHESFVDAEGEPIAGGRRDEENPLLSQCSEDEKASFRFVGSKEPKENGVSYILCEELPSW